MEGSAVPLADCTIVCWEIVEGKRGEAEASDDLVSTLHSTSTSHLTHTSTTTAPSLSAPSALPPVPPPSSSSSSARRPFPPSYASPAALNSVWSLERRLTQSGLPTGISIELHSLLIALRRFIPVSFSRSARGPHPEIDKTTQRLLRRCSRSVCWSSGLQVMAAISRRVFPLLERILLPSSCAPSSRQPIDPPGSPTSVQGPCAHCCRVLHVTGIDTSLSFCRLPLSFLPALPPAALPYI